jgi:polygalacturonase
MQVLTVATQGVGVINSPARTYSISNPAPLTITNVVIDNCTFFLYTRANFSIYTHMTLALGDKTNSNSSGKAAGHNTDGCAYSNCIFNRPLCLSVAHPLPVDCSTHNLLITDSVIHNQDDCLAINKGTNITFQRNKCTGGHGISVVCVRSFVPSLLQLSKRL